jgi:hypothetical protein
LTSLEVTVASLRSRFRFREGGLTVNSCDIRFPGFDARSARGPIRWELFLDRDVRDVLVTQRPDTLRIVYRGDPDPVTWAAALRSAGFPEPVFDDPAQVGEHGTLVA